MTEKTIDVLKDVHDRTLMVRFVIEPGRLRAAVAIPAGAGDETIDADDVELALSHGGTPLRVSEGSEPHRIETRSRGVTVHILFDLEPPSGVRLGAEEETFECTLTFRGVSETFEIRL